jgi:hypothetical protein
MLPPHMTVTLRFLHRDDESNCILYYTKEAGPGPEPASISDEADWFDAAFRAKVRQCINPDCTWLGIKVRYLTLDLDLEGYSTDGPGVGTAVSDDVEPEEVAVLIQRRTSLPGRNKRGRIFVPCVPSDYLEGSALTETAVGFYSALALEMQETQVNTATANTWVPVQPNWKDGTLIPVTHTRLDSEVKSRRDRREPKRSIILQPG